MSKGSNMASRPKHTSLTANQRASLASKSSIPRQRQMDQNRKFSTVPEMSPEARRAVLLAREDTKENNINSQKRDGSSNPSIQKKSMDITVDTNNNTSSSRDKRESTRGERNIKTSHSSRSPQKALNRNTVLPSSRPPRGPNTGTSRSRSTLSQNEPPFSMSDNNEISSHFGTNTTSNASVYTSNLSSGNNNNNNGNNLISNNNMNENVDANANDDDPDDDVDSAFPNDESFDDDEEEEEDTAFKTNSFVVALDKALEKNDISRLKGDITDAAQISKPGTVRALNGGRLTNAQEVVVNVCYDDDTELVFHDDDEETVDTAKAISQIRVNIWMEYNSRFPPDNDVNEFDPHFSDSNSNKREPEVRQRPQRPPTASVVRSREKSFVANQKQQGPPRDTIIRKPSADNGSVKNQNGTFKRTASNPRLRNITPSPTPSSRQGSGNSSRGKVNSVNSSTKHATPLRTRR